MIEDIFEPDAIDFYDWDELERLQEKSKNTNQRSGNAA